MRGILTNSKTGEIGITTFLRPKPPPVELWCTHFSLIGTGTERAKIETGEKSLLAKVMVRPAFVRQVFDYSEALEERQPNCAALRT